MNNLHRMTYRAAAGLVIKAAATGFLGIFFSIEAQAQAYYSENTKTVAHLGTQGTNFYVQFVEGTSQLCNEIYIAPERKAMYVQLLTAKLTGSKITRVDYSITNGVCWAELIELNAIGQ